MVVKIFIWRVGLGEKLFYDKGEQFPSLSASKIALKNIKFWSHNWQWWKLKYTLDFALRTNILFINHSKLLLKQHIFSFFHDIQFLLHVNIWKYIFLSWFSLFFKLRVREYFHSTQSFQHKSMRVMENLTSILFLSFQHFCLHKLVSVSSQCLIMTNWNTYLSMIFTLWKARIIRLLFWMKNFFMKNLWNKIYFKGNVKVSQII